MMAVTMDRVAARRMQNANANAHDNEAEFDAKNA
jgi:hypothetical protein